MAVACLRNHPRRVGCWTTSRRHQRRQAGLQQVEATFEPLPFDATAARSYGQVVAAVIETGRSHRRRLSDLLAATAHANGLAIYTRNPDDFAGLSISSTSSASDRRLLATTIAGASSRHPSATGGTAIDGRMSNELATRTMSRCRLKDLQFRRMFNVIAGKQPRHFVDVVSHHLVASAEVRVSGMPY